MFKEKLVEKPKKSKKKHNAAFYVIGAFTFALEGMLGINAAFLIDQSVAIVAHNMLDGTAIAVLAPSIALVLSLVIGVCFMFAGYWTFSGFMNSLEDAKAFYKQYARTPWPMALVWALALFVVALDYTTLGFRASYFAEKGAAWLMAFFALLIPMVWVLGVFMHVVENTPLNRRLSKVSRYTETMTMQDIEEAFTQMDPDLRIRALRGEDVLAEHQDRVAKMREDNRLFEESRMLDRERARQQKEENNNPPFLPAFLGGQQEN